MKMKKEYEGGYLHYRYMWTTYYLLIFLIYLSQISCQLNTTDSIQVKDFRMQQQNQGDSLIHLNEIRTLGTTSNVLNLGDRSVPLVQITGSNSLGCRMSSGGDFNGDGIRDFFLAAKNEGFAYLIYGSSSINSDFDVLNAFTGILFQAASSDSLGSAVSMNGDNNNDGHVDILVAAGGYNSNTGIVYLIFGDTSSPYSSTNPFVLSASTPADPYAIRIFSSSTGGSFGKKFLFLFIFRYHICYFHHLFRICGG